MSPQMTISFDTAPCFCVSEHAPKVPWCHWHHIFPLEHGGPDTPENKVSVCPPLHDQIHVVLRASVKAKKLITRPRGFNVWGYRLACVGWSHMKEAGVV